MSDFKDRIIIEYREIYSKRMKLNNFIHNTEPYNPKLQNSMSLLIAQLYAMDTYIQILRLRCLELGISWRELDESKCN